MGQLLLEREGVKHSLNHQRYLVNLVNLVSLGMAAPKAQPSA